MGDTIIIEKIQTETKHYKDGKYRGGAIIIEMGDTIIIEMGDTIIIEKIQTETKHYKDGKYRGGAIIIEMGDTIIIEKYRPRRSTIKTGNIGAGQIRVQARSRGGR